MKVDIQKAYEIFGKIKGVESIDDKTPKFRIAGVYTFSLKNKKMVKAEEYVHLGIIVGIATVNKERLKDPNLLSKIREFIGFYDGLSGESKRREMMIEPYVFDPNYEEGYRKGEMKKKFPEFLFLD